MFLVHTGDIVKRFKYHWPLGKRTVADHKPQPCVPGDRSRSSPALRPETVDTLAPAWPVMKQVVRGDSAGFRENPSGPFCVVADGVEFVVGGTGNEFYAGKSDGPVIPDQAILAEVVDEV